LFGFALCCGTAYAELVGTEEAAASLESANPDAEREKVRAFVERPEVVKQLQKLGVSPEDAKARVETMSDAEVHMISGRLEALPAGGRISNTELVIIILLAVIILILVL
jgi:hypothetical protein